MIWGIRGFPFRRRYIHGANQSQVEDEWHNGSEVGEGLGKGAFSEGSPFAGFRSLSELFARGEIDLVAVHLSERDRSKPVVESSQVLGSS
jgi:hypothetical protein